ncbi:hypothetical protein O6H91_Y535500 [Diphasiastrum complanatum]|nr:hypothetical protein O6H91_Y535500 [Diphasiastrum complanatum]
MASSRHSDSWMKECEEAMRLADDVSALVTHRVSMLLSGLDPSRLLPTIRQKLTMLVTKLDRLESLLRNPPVNVNLSDKELLRREDLLLQIRTKTKEIAGSLRVPQASKRWHIIVYSMCIIMAAHFSSAFIF